MTSSGATVVLRPGREKPVRNRHPWVFSGAIGRIEGEPADGDVVDVLDQDHCFLARGYINRHSQIAVRLLSWVQDEPVDAAFWRSRIQQAVDRRRGLLESQQTTACRLIHAESDLLPGLVVDRYGDYLVLQALTLGIDRRKPEIVPALVEVMHPTGIYERSDVDVREKEHLPPAAGALWGEEPPDLLEVVENQHRFQVDVRHGQKTGFYLDQRVNRETVTRFCAEALVLNVFAYTGGFAVYAASAGAKRITNVDSSAEALALSRRNIQRNGFGDLAAEYVVGDAFNVLRQFRAEKRLYDVVILDPPKFAHSRSQLQAACRGYKDINLVAMQLVRPGGILFTMSCSGLVSPDLFQKVVFGASVDAGRHAQVVEKLSQPCDHPILLAFPEGEYLKGLACRIL